jgi:DNA-binding MarR family transcriptional regulator
MTNRLDEFRLAAWRAFLNAHAAVIDRIEREMAQAGVLPLGSYDVLVALLEAPDHRLRLHELARHIVLSRSTLTRVVDRLEADGLLVRERAQTDRRGAYAVLTETGRAALKRAWPVYARGIHAHFARYLSEEEVRTLTEALGRIDAAARQTSPSPAARRLPRSSP